MLEVRLFASAREAVGAQMVAVAPGPVHEVCSAIADGAEPGRRTRIEAVLAVSTLLCDGVRYRAADDAPLPDGAVLDVLPPFAGG